MHILDSAPRMSHIDTGIKPDTAGRLHHTRQNKLPPKKTRQSTNTRLKHQLTSTEIKTMVQRHKIIIIKLKPLKSDRVQVSKHHS